MDPSLEGGEGVSPPSSPAAVEAASSPPTEQEPAAVVAADPAEVPLELQPVEQEESLDPRIITLIVGGIEFQVAKAFLSIHSPLWAERLRADPSTIRVVFRADPEQASRPPTEIAEEFGRFLSFLGGGEENGEDSEVTSENVVFLLRWAADFEVDYLFSLCESFLMQNGPEAAGTDVLGLLELAARHDLPLLYARCCEQAAQSLGHVRVPEDLRECSDSRFAVFTSQDMRDDLVTSQICMEGMRRDSEARRRIRFADYTAQIPTVGRQRARVLWKNRCKLTNQARQAKKHEEMGAAKTRKSYALGEWRTSPSVVWPHDSFRDKTWPMVPGETQPLC